MRKQLRLTASASMLLGASVLGAPGLAQAAECSTLSNPVYVAGSSAVKPFLARVAAELAALNPSITVVYQGQGSCTGIQAMTSVTPGTITGTGVVWNTDGSEVSGGCSLSLAGTAVDIGVSDVYASSCSATLPNGVKDFYGPIQAMTFAVPASSNQTSISAEAAYLLMGFGTNGAVAPWTESNPGSGSKCHFRHPTDDCRSHQGSRDEMAGCRQFWLERRAHESGGGCHRR
ncbi:MAG: hypothetical protein QM784_21090 [Polyangiaceae bacterium]